jgi:hypothetical protein
MKVAFTKGVEETTMLSLYRPDFIIRVVNWVKVQYL